MTTASLFDDLAAPADIVRFTFLIYVAVVPYSTFPASSRR